MTDDSPQPASLAHVVSEGYDFQAIRAQLGGNAAPPYFVIHAEGKIRGLCLGLLWNPRAEADPCEAWVGKKGDLPRWGLKLAETTGPLPVYVRREEGGKWFFIGNYGHWNQRGSGGNQTSTEAANHHGDFSDRVPQASWAVVARASIRRDPQSLTADIADDIADKKVFIRAICVIRG